MSTAPRPLRCRAVRGLLGAFAATDLEAAVEGQVRNHLVRCNPCRLEAARAARAAQALQAVSALPAACDDAFFAAMHQEVVASVRGEAVAPAPAPLRRRTSVVAAAALFAAGFAVSLVLPRDGGLHVRPPIRIAPDARDGSAPSAGGGRTSMQPLGQEQWLGPHPGLMGRLELRSLEQMESEGFQVRPPSQDQSFPRRSRVGTGTEPAPDPAGSVERR